MMRYLHVAGHVLESSQRKWVSSNSRHPFNQALRWPSNRLGCESFLCTRRRGCFPCGFSINPLWGVVFSSGIGTFTAKLERKLLRHVERSGGVIFKPVIVTLIAPSGTKCFVKFKNKIRGILFRLNLFFRVMLDVIV